MATQAGLDRVEEGAVAVPLELGDHAPASPATLTQDEITNIRRAAKDYEHMTRLHSAARPA